MTGDNRPVLQWSLTPITSWSAFIKAAQNEGSGQTSVLEAAPDLCGIYFWANGID